MFQIDCDYPHHEWRHVQSQTFQFRLFNDTISLNLGYRCLKLLWSGRTITYDVKRTILTLTLDLIFRLASLPVNPPEQFTIFPVYIILSFGRVVRAHSGFILVPVDTEFSQNIAWYCLIFDNEHIGVKLSSAHVCRSPICGTVLISCLIHRAER